MPIKCFWKLLYESRNLFGLFLVPQELLIISILDFTMMYIDAITIKDDASYQLMSIDIVPDRSKVNTRYTLYSFTITCPVTMRQWQILNQRYSDMRAFQWQLRYWIGRLPRDSWLKSIGDAYLKVPFPHKHYRRDNTRIIEERVKMLQTWFQHLFNFRNECTRWEADQRSDHVDFETMLRGLNAFLKYPSNAFVMKTKAADAIIDEETGRMMISKVKGEMCSICIEDFKGDNPVKDDFGDGTTSMMMKMQQEVLELSCGHFFHGNCVAKWLSAKKTCPVCRERVRFVWQLVTTPESFCYMVGCASKAYVH
jgi:hypothetical protein